MKMFCLIMKIIIVPIAHREKKWILEGVLKSQHHWVHKEVLHRIRETKRIRHVVGVEID